MNRIRDTKRGCLLIGIALIATLGLASSAAAPAEAGGKKGGKQSAKKKLKYGVTSFNYDASGDLSAKRGQSSCVAGESARWGGGTTSQVDYLLDDSELHPLNVGKAKLKVRKVGGFGTITINGAPMRNRFVGLHHVATACFLGFTSGEKATPCNPAEFNSRLFVRGEIRPTGKKTVEVNWVFQQGAGGEESYVPRAECGGETFVYPTPECTSTSSVKKLKQKKPRLTFGDCQVIDTVAPNTDEYQALGHATGLVQLKRNDK